MQGARVTVVGAGVVGVCCAAYLQRAGHQVTLIDARPVGTACSFGNAGVIAPGACLPLAMPGILGHIPRYLMDPMGPLAIRWRDLPRSLPWLVAWVRASAPQRARRISRAMRALHEHAFECIGPLLTDAGIPDIVERSGQLYVSRNPNGAVGGSFAAELLRDAGVDARALGPGEVRDLEPALSASIVSGLYFPDHGHVRDPHRLVVRLAGQIVRQGGEVVADRVNGFECSDGRVVAALCEKARRPVDVLLIAAGAWSHRLTAQLGTRVRLIAERGYHAMLPEPGPMPRRPISSVDFRFATTPMESGLRFAGTVEIADADAPPDYARARKLIELGRSMFPGVNVAGATQWMGARPSLPDGLPVIDRSPRFSNAFFAFGHAHHGLMGAAPTGRLVADLVTGRTPFIDPAPYSVMRL